MADPLPRTRLPSILSADVMAQTPEIQSELFDLPEDSREVRGRRSTSLPPTPTSASTSGSPPARPSEPSPAAEPGTEIWQFGGRPISIQFVRHPRARRYRLTWLRDGRARCTLPRRGSMAEARRFVERCREWITTRVEQTTPGAPTSTAWGVGTRLYFRGTETPLQEEPGAGQLRLADFVFKAPRQPTSDLRKHVQLALRWLAAVELPPRVLELAALHEARVRRVTIRDQRSRWGSCSVRGTISLNWRLIQVPPEVADYIILHELAHLRHMNHSKAFWLEVERICPRYRECEAWIKANGRRLL